MVSDLLHLICPSLGPPMLLQTLLFLFLFFWFWCRPACLALLLLPVLLDILHAIGGFPDSSVGKASTCSAGDLGLIPGLGRSPGERKGYPLQYSGLEHSMDCTIHGVTKSQTWLRAFHFTALHTVSLPRSISWSFPLCFLLEVLQFWIFNPFWVDLCVV